jgi:pantetheine-phosphate adenylyltransferase
MKRIAVFPGTFDPITQGHAHLVERAARMFDHIIVAIGHNTSKQTMFTLEERKRWVEATFEALPHVTCEVYQGLTVDFCMKKEAGYLLRGLRNTLDFEYEKSIAQMNRALNPHVETVLLFTDPHYASVQSTIVREIWRNKGDISAFVPQAVLQQ